MCGNALRALDVLYPEKPRLTTSNRRINSRSRAFPVSSLVFIWLVGYMIMNGLTSLQSTLERETSRGFGRSLEEGVTKQDDLRIGNLMVQLVLFREEMPSQLL